MIDTREYGYDETGFWCVAADPHKLPAVNVQTRVRLEPEKYAVSSGAIRGMLWALIPSLLMWIGIVWFFRSCA